MEAKTQPQQRYKISQYNHPYCQASILAYHPYLGVNTVLKALIGDEFHPLSLMDKALVHSKACQAPIFEIIKTETFC
jgi:hypothetical protein